MTILIPSDVTTLIHIVESIIAIQIIVSSLELLKVHHVLNDQGLLSWRVQRLSNFNIVKRLKLDLILIYPRVILIICFKILLSILLLLFIAINFSTILLLLSISLINLLLTLRCAPSNDGSDQMSSIIILAVTLAECVNSDFSKSSALIFIACQASLAYGTSGLLKIKTKGWYDGSFAVQILKTSSYGNETILKYVINRRLLSKFLGITVSYGDCCLALAFLFPPQICLVVLLFGLFLHIGIGLIMGLNTFLWAFGAAYPAIFFLSFKIH